FSSVSMHEVVWVHAITDVTGFGLAGHALEMAKGAQATIQIDWKQVPLLPEARRLAEAGHVTGASGRNWAGYGENIRLGSSISPTDQALLTDPQTSGGLLVSCAPESQEQVLKCFAESGFNGVVIGSVAAGPALVKVD
ncbi:MAG: AIR synthase-related protein, partial [Burkholderiaceae bacterium]